MKNELSVEAGVRLHQISARQAGEQELHQGLAELREALLRLHKTLIESERAGYEKIFGRIASPFQFLQLLTNDPWFAWLHPVSQLVAAMDEMLDAKEPLPAAGVKALTGQAKSLLVATPGGDGFSGHYDEALQRDPDVVFAHAEVARLMRGQCEVLPAVQAMTKEL